MNLALFKAILMSSDLNVSKKKTKPLFLAGVLSERKALFSLTILVREAGLEVHVFHFMYSNPSILAKYK